jgi:hypothetical protein
MHCTTVAVAVAVVRSTGSATKRDSRSLVGVMVGVVMVVGVLVVGG